MRSLCSKFSVKALFVVVAIGALGAWDLRRQLEFDRAMDRFDSVFPGSFLTFEEPSTMRKLQSRLLGHLGLKVTNRQVKTVEVYPEDPTQIRLLTQEQAKLLEELPQARHILLNNFEFSLAKVSFRLRPNSNSSLYLGGCRLQNSSLRDLQMPFLTRFSMSGCEAIEGLDSIDAAFPLLQKLALDYCPPIENLPKSLRNCKQLHRLALSGKNINNDALQDIELLQSLEFLTVWNNARVTDDSMLAVGKLRNLRFVELSGTHVTDRTVAVLAQLPKLEKLVLSRNVNVTNQAIDQLRVNERLSVVVGQ